MSAAAVKEEQPTVVATPAPTPAEQSKVEDVVISDVKADKPLSFTTSFTVTWTDKETGRVHIGTFSAKRPSLGDLGRIAVITAKLNGGEKVDPQTDFIHSMMAGLQVVITDAPDWWIPEAFFDATPLRKVWDHVKTWIDTFRNGRVV